MQTAIEYTYKAAFGRSAMYVQGPFHFVDDGRDPVVQAKERCAKYGDTVESAARVMARPLADYTLDDVDAEGRCTNPDGHGADGDA